MLIEVLKSKLHCAIVTEANLHYMGSITIDEDLLDAANYALMDFEEAKTFKPSIVFPKEGNRL